MKSKFGLLEKLEFLQTFSSSLISSINPAVIHNIEKYLAIKKSVYLNSLENQNGDYIEFGVYKGSSFCHAIKCFKSCKRFNSNQKKTNFFGFDSFQGFGDLNADEKHSFYKNENFKSNYNKVKKRVEKTMKGWSEFKLIKGYFEQTLLHNPSYYGIKNVRVAFIDSDTYSSSKLAFIFLEKIVSPGTHIILDDFFSYNGDENKGVAKAFSEFIENTSFNYRKIFDYGMGGIVIVLTNKK
jgi:O-methyltransferase